MTDNKVLICVTRESLAPSATVLKYLSAVLCSLVSSTSSIIILNILNCDTKCFESVLALPSGRDLIPAFVSSLLPGKLLKASLRSNKTSGRDLGSLFHRLHSHPSRLTFSLSAFILLSLFCFCPFNLSTSNLSLSHPRVWQRKRLNLTCFFYLFSFPV